MHELDNKEIWCCDFFGTRINLQNPYLSLCHDAFVGQRKIGYLKDYSPHEYYEKLIEIARDNEYEKSHCRRCQKCKKQIYKFRKLNWVTINTSWYCNSSCIYCMGHYASPEDGAEVLNVIKQFHELGLFDEDCLFDWGGGEPTLNPIFNETSEWLIKHNYCQRINTNGIKYSSIVEDALKHNRTTLRLSIDAGTEECFKKIKGTNAYYDVWNNIKEYRKYSDQIYLKYNFFNLNANKNEVDVFLAKCKEIDIRYLIIDAEVKSYQPDKYAGPLYYTQESFDGMHYFYDKAFKMGFKVSISDYAFSYRPEYNNGELALPSKYYDNLDRDIISNGIMLETEPSVNRLLETLRNNNKGIIIRGFGYEGKLLYRILKNAGIKIEYVVDMKEPNAGTNVVKVKKVSDFLSDNNERIVILAGRYWQEMLKEINDNKKDNFQVFYMMGLYYEKYIEEIENNKK